MYHIFLIFEVNTTIYRAKYCYVKNSKEMRLNSCMLESAMKHFSEMDRFGEFNYRTEYQFPASLAYSPANYTVIKLAQIIPHFGLSYLIQSF